MGIGIDEVKWGVKKVNGLSEKELKGQQGHKDD